MHAFGMRRVQTVGLARGFFGSSRSLAPLRRPSAHLRASSVGDSLPRPGRLCCSKSEPSTHNERVRACPHEDAIAHIPTTSALRACARSHTDKH
eukprot:174858-Pleurochrysis_carterae.AAC.1